MDSTKAKKLEQHLLGKTFRSYKILELVNSGKSAAVFKAIDDNALLVAIKIFDNDLVEKFGHEIQDRRIEQEITLKGHTIPNLVGILDGGKEEIDGEEFYCIIMEYIEGQNLRQFIASKTYDVAFPRRVVQTLFTVSEALLAKGIVHRDIKPENVMISRGGEVTLMDLGVLKLIGVRSFTDYEERQFVGTLRYAPPEFLTRSEQDTAEGWRSVNLYQIGGVLHDLITKEELFYDRTPYTNLVFAIKEDAPKISSSGFPFSLTQLARDLLVKEWKLRLSLCSDRRIEEACSSDHVRVASFEKEIDDLLTMTSENRAKFEEIEKITRSNQERASKSADIANRLERILNECVKRIGKKGVFDNQTKLGLLPLSLIGPEFDNQELRIHVYKIEGEIVKGFSRPLYLVARISNDQNALTHISFLCAFVAIDPRFENTPQFLKQLASQITTSLQRLPTRAYEAFFGTAGFDEEFSEAITVAMIKIIKVALQGIMPEVKAELERRERVAISGGTNAGGHNQSKETKVFYEVT